jgi:hypothetical protein
MYHDNDVGLSYSIIVSLITSLFISLSDAPSNIQIHGDKRICWICAYIRIQYQENDARYPVFPAQKRFAVFQQLMWKCIAQSVSRDLIGSIK